MKNHLISMYIDEELSLDDKIEFVETVRRNADFTDEALAFLNQEKWLRSDVTDYYPSPSLRTTSGWIRPLLRPIGIFASGLATALLVLFLTLPKQDPQFITHRFVLYQPDATRAEVAGTFTDWSPVPMSRTGAGGYWEVVLDLPVGVHRFSYIIDQERRKADPTILTREVDDFGGENSIFEVKTKT